MTPHRAGRRAVLRTAVALAALAGPTSVWSTAAVAAGSGPAAGSSAPAAAPGDPADWLRLAGGRLVYGQDRQGNRIPDFSYAGYRGGGVPLPTAKAAVTLGPGSGGDDTDRVQQAIDRVAALPQGSDGLRGAVQLGAGTYRLAKPLRIGASGVVLRGAGSGPGGTRLVATGAPHVLVELAGEGAPRRSGEQHAVTDAYVPVGATTLTLASTAGLEPGRTVIVQRPQEDSWIRAIGMDRIPARDSGTTKPWTPNDGLRFQRTVTAVDGNRITLDVPLTNALEKEFTHATVWAYDFPGRISQVGVEGISADGSGVVSAPGYDSDGYVRSGFAHFAAVQDGWLRDIVADGFGSGMGSIGSTASRITVTDTAAIGMEKAIPQRSPLAQPGAYTVDGQQNLIVNCTVSGSNLHAWMTGPRVPGPNVFSHCTSDNTGRYRLDAGPHQRWAAGTLYDAITMRHSRGPADDLALTDRGNMGTGQGWAGANQVLWNADVGYYAVERPPTAHNWAFGTRGTPVEGRQSGVLVSTGTAMTPASLYAQQLAERGGQAPPPPTATPAPVPAPAAPTPSASASATATGAPTAASAGTRSSAPSPAATPAAARRPETRDGLASTGAELGAELSMAAGALLVGSAAIGLTRERRRARHAR
ncbi:hypothetical protein AB0K43_24150 [Kitasatospora sp. NPDC049258]|uniref:hypothetical protein n=1 Tax=Kitasatospora sp. NPDC049258 TaxID=3155394 RepID=UPI003433E4DD